MDAETLDNVKKTALAIFSIAERITLKPPTARESAEADKLIGQAASAILEAVQGARGDAGGSDSQERICIATNASLVRGDP